MKNILLLVWVFIIGCTFFPSWSQAEKLPANLKWETNNTEPVFENYHPVRGGEYRTYINSFPQTFRLYGLNSNSGGFITYNRMWAFWSMVTRHPTTGKIIPMLATHWALLPDQKTAYFKLDPDARWSDGQKITADDYIFAFTFLQSKDIKDPFYNQYIRDHYNSVTKIDDYTLKVVAKKPSWQLLDEIDIVPLPKHKIKLDKDWNTTANWESNVVPGPYVLSSFKKGQNVTFKRLDPWWGDNKRYFKDLYHFDSVRIDVIQSPDTAFALFKKGELSTFAPNAIIWSEQLNTPEVERGYILKQKLKVESPTGASGFFFNNMDPLWKSPELRHAFALTIDFPTLNKNIFYSLYERKHVFFDVMPPYKDEAIPAYPFDITQAEKLLDQAGWKRAGGRFRQKAGETLHLKITTGNEDALKYLPFIKETAAKAGIEVEIQKLDGPTFFDAINQRHFQAVLLAFGGGRFPAPRQFLHTETLVAGSNNIFMFGSKEMDKWIETYEYDLSEKNRIQAIDKIEEAIHQSSVFVPGWKEESERLLRWRYIKAPPELGYKTGIDFNLFYFDPAEKQKLDQARSAGEALDKPAATLNPYSIP